MMEPRPRRRRKGLRKVRTHQRGRKSWGGMSIQWASLFSRGLDLTYCLICCIEGMSEIGEEEQNGQNYSILGKYWVSGRLKV